MNIFLRKKRVMTGDFSPRNALDIVSVSLWSRLRAIRKNNMEIIEKEGYI